MAFPSLVSPTEDRRRAGGRGGISPRLPRRHRLGGLRKKVRRLLPFTLCAWRDAHDLENSGTLHFFAEVPRVLVGDVGNLGKLPSREGFACIQERLNERQLPWVEETRGKFLPNEARLLPGGRQAGVG